MRIKQRLCLLLAIFMFAPMIHSQTPKSKKTLFVNVEPILKRLENDLDASRLVLSSIKVDTLPVSYQEEKFIEDSVASCKKWLSVIDLDMASLRRGQSLSLNVALLFDVGQFDSCTNGLIGLLNSPIPYEKPEAAQRTLKWAQELAATRERINPSMMVVHGEVARMMKVADSILEECGSTQP